MWLFSFSGAELLPTTARKRLLGELILRENFFRFFLHWNEEVCASISPDTLVSFRLDGSPR